MPDWLLKLSSSSLLNWNMKSCGNRSRFRLTARTSCPVFSRRSEVARLERLLRVVPNRQDLDRVSNDAVERAVRRPFAAAVVNFAKLELECACFRSQGSSKWTARERVELVQKAVVPRCRNFE